jgi:hypothetical protein
MHLERRFPPYKKRRVFSLRKCMAAERKRSGEVAVLSVAHPILGTELEIGAHTIRIGPEQYLALADELCQIAFLAPHLAARIQRLSRHLGVPEVSQYIVWMHEADREALARISIGRHR